MHNTDYTGWTTESASGLREAKERVALLEKRLAQVEDICVLLCKTVFPKVAVSNDPR